jgi:phosphoglycerate dehydrogenase-like enzyme
MAEHALAMALAAAKRLVLEHENLKRGQLSRFDGQGERQQLSNGRSEQLPPSDSVGRF